MYLHQFAVSCICRKGGRPWFSNAILHCGQNRENVVRNVELVQGMNLLQMLFANLPPVKISNRIMLEFFVVLR